MFDFDLLSCLQQISLEICERLENIRKKKTISIHHYLLFSQIDESFARKEAAVVKPEPAWI